MLLLTFCTSIYKQAPKQTYLFVYVYGMVLLGSSCTLVYKQAPNKPFLVVYVYGVVLLLAFVLRCTNRHQNLFLVVYVYEVVLLVASCTSVYKQAPKQTYLAGLYFFYVYGVAFSRSL